MTHELLDAAVGQATARPVVPAAGVRRGAGAGEVRLDGGFWGDLQGANARASLRHCLTWMERLGWLANFDRVAEGATGAERPGWQFSDSEVYKLMEALAWEYGRTGDADADGLLEELTARVARAQDADGYLNTCFGHAGQRPRYSDLESGHELYCTGHLLQAAVAVHRTGAPGGLVPIARRAADEVCRTFGAGAREGICGHPEIEVGLAELGRALDEPRYLEQARLFVERRGRGLLAPIALLSPAYFQDDVPVREADAWRGHAVRALYLTAAAVDVAVDTGDAELLAAVERQWERSVGRRTYITGGMGSRHQDEGFGEDWELPPDRAYCETCAGVASVMVSWRLYLATGDVRYADLVERTFYNVVATSPRSDGRAFFYANPLQQRVAGTDVLEDAENARAEGGVRAPWFDVSCCPTNVARTLATWHTYAAAVEGDTVSLLQYAAGEVDVELPGGDRVVLRVTTGYPVDGDVAVEVVSAPDRPLTLRLRVPHWASGAVLDTADGTSAVEPGWADVPDVVAGRRVTLRLPVEPRFTWPDPRIDAVRGCVAVERGPVVLCLESTDLPAGVGLDDVRLDAGVEPVTDGDGARVRVRATPAVESPFPYGGRPAVATAGDAHDVRMVPYHQWAEREPSTMRVFVPTLPAS
ncbi:glycoside hydrolase family 127 protein [uncultured Cellulomonas sp.]|uniref:glycoside hydrolase family 127 protein n=1 Tax=uncultured Cellulomonas sp. TaxID=189682 RepID=UPI00262472CF|nr:beta-L-arabinofuranosidase domain-containing protein [uncultured Cellulomonas sp.]